MRKTVARFCAAVCGYAFLGLIILFLFGLVGGSLRPRLLVCAAGMFLLDAALSKYGGPQCS